MATYATRTLDPTGNWTDYVQKTGGSTDLDQDRDHGEANEVTDITETTGTAWTTPVYDRAGNATGVPRVEVAGYFTCYYDAWNRLIRALRDGGESRSYRHGLNRRTAFVSHRGSVATPRFYYSNDSWQTLETRLGDYDSSSGYPDVHPDTLQPEWQYIYSPRYIDAPVLRDESTDSDGRRSGAPERTAATRGRCCQGIHGCLRRAPSFHCIPVLLRSPDGRGGGQDPRRGTPGGVAG